MLKRRLLPSESCIASILEDATMQNKVEMYVMYVTILQQTNLDLYSTPKRWLVIVFSTIACGVYVGTNGG